MGGSTRRTAWLGGEGWPAVEQAVAGWRAAGARVVTTNGCFDGLHAGHLALLHDARGRGDRLVVGLNDDASVRALKGDDRPRHTASRRASVLAALPLVDAVVIFADLLPFAFLDAIRPAVHCKGGDYDADGLPEAPLVRGWGGRIHIVPRLADHSTTGPGVARADGPELEVLLDVLGAANCVRRTAFALARGIAEVADELGRRLARGRAVLACGNGGSAADADHFAAELVGRFSQPRPAFRARSLGGDAATLTALANDFGYAEVFARQVEAWSDEGDALIVMSTSARSPSVVRAAEVARSRRLFVVALTGADPGPLAVLADRVLAVPSTEVAWVQQAHGAILHALCRRIDGTT